MAPYSEDASGCSGMGKSFPVDVPVLIVGGGPTRLLLAFMLSQLSVKSLIIERYPSRLRAPKAHALSPRSLEICRQFGIDVNTIRDIGTRRKDAYWVNFVSSLTTDYVGSIPYERMDAEMIHNVPQPVFEELIATRLKEEGKVEIRKNHSYIRCEQIGEQVVTTIEDRGTNREYQIRSNQVVACDGAKSKVRESLGIRCEGESSYETMMTIHFNANLRKVLGNQVGMLYWIMNPEVSGFIIGYDLDGNQVLICNLDPEKHPIESWDDRLCRKTVTAAIGQAIPFDILSYRPWVLSRKVAESYRIGNVFLAGDAAHSFPPTGGLGLNSGLGDVHNLAYKIAAVHQGWGRESLLNSYQADRRQVALVNSLQSLKNGHQIFGLLKTLGTTNQNVEKAKEDLHKRITDSRIRPSILKGIERQREHFDNLGLHIGYVYGDTEVPPSASLYIPSYRSGARLPHAWVSILGLSRLPAIDSSYISEFTREEVKAKEYSTLDLCDFDAFTLIFEKSFAADWKMVVEQVYQRLPKTAAESLKINSAVLGVDFKLAPGTRGEEWIKGLQLRQGASVLIRPDQHILNTFGSYSTAAQVAEELMEHLGL